MCYGTAFPSGRLTMRFRNVIISVVLSSIIVSPLCVHAQGKPLDAKVEAFLDENKNTWHDLNVPYADGKALYDIIIKNKYTRALEIGTSTGHSSIWIAWALSKTGGKLTTIEIDKGRRETALENFRKAGLDGYIDSRLADAHELVPKLEGPYDFIFVDADKGWYTNYLKALEPKIVVGGCYTAHNVNNNRRLIGDFMEYLESLKNFDTEVIRASSSGLSVSYKKSE